MPPITVRCDDEPVRAAVQRWLDAGRIEPPLPLEIAIRIGDVVVPPQGDSRPIFHQPEISIRSSGTDDRVTITWDTWPASAELPSKSTTAEVRLSRDAVDHLDGCLRHFLITVLIFLLRRAGWHHVHAATAVDTRGRGWLLAGNSEAGKSTTAALLATRGWAVGSDDITFLEARPGGRVTAHAFRTRLALRSGGEALLARAGGQTLSGRGKVGFWPEELGGSWAPEVEPDILLFTRVGDTVTEVEPMRPADTLAELVRWSAWVALEPALAQDHLDLLSALGAQARAFRVRLGRDLFDDANLIERVIP
ncbi:MAG TPA: hypothetical protein VEI47_01140 [Gemmatimonadales bacterium]|nr:hypothetical protein [Gemmatimonadales bacterium]